jgi:nucleotide sugar dehydrogenase
VVDLVVVGLGYVGLPLAMEASRAGLSVVGLDERADVVEGLRAGRSHVKDQSDAAVAELLEAGFAATTNPDDIENPQVIVVCVATPLDEQGAPDLGDVRRAFEAVAGKAGPGALLVLESTTHPGTTDDIVRPIVEKQTGLTVGQDISLAFSPERMDTGNASFGLRNTPKVVGGVTPSCTAAAVDFYGHVCNMVVPAKSAREAEMSKLVENIYRNVNIALVNELAAVAHQLDVDIWNAIDCAATKPFGFQAFYPGPGVGGHCIPSDPVYLTHLARRSGVPARLVELAGEVNDRMPAYIGDRALAVLERAGVELGGATVLLAGVTYKPDSDDMTSTPAEPLARSLRAGGVEVRFCDPNVGAWAVDGHVVHREEDLLTAAARADLVVLLQNHREFDLDRLRSAAPRLFDTRGTLRVPDVETL